MVYSKNIVVDPWLKNQGEYSGFDKIPENTVFVCAYVLFINPFEVGESAFFRRTEKDDELWVGSWNEEISGEPKDYVGREEFDKFGCAVTAPSAGTERQACQALLSHRFRSLAGFTLHIKFIEAGMIQHTDYQDIIDSLKKELNKYSEKADETASKIIDIARELGLNPEPTGNGLHSWRAKCPRTSHPLYINTESDTFGCGWCKRKGGPDELKAFVKERICECR